MPLNPAALAKIIEESRRYATIGRCPKCRAQTITGVDHEVSGTRVHLDPHRIGPLDELAAILAGITTYAAWRIGPVGHRYELGMRTSESLTRPPHGGRHPILAEHRCDTCWPDRPNLADEINATQEIPDEPPF